MVLLDVSMVKGSVQNESLEFLLEDLSQETSPSSEEAVPHGADVEEKEVA